MCGFVVELGLPLIVPCRAATESTILRLKICKFSGIERLTSVDTALVGGHLFHITGRRKVVVQNQGKLGQVGMRAVTAFETNETYFTMMRDWHRQHDGVAVEPRVKQVIESHCVPGSRILDAGCGEGSVSRFFAKKHPGVDFHGLDVSPIGIALASKGAPDNVRFQVAKLTRTPFDSDFFDFIFSQSVLEHVEDWEGMLREMRRILKPGGSLMIRVENGGRNEKHLFKALMDIVFHRNHVVSSEPTFELKPGDLEAHMGNFDLHEIPSDVLERTMKSLGFSVSISTCQEHLAVGASGWKKIILRAIGGSSTWPFNHAGYTTIAIGSKSQNG